jgi:hypothetical protein
MNITNVQKAMYDFVSGVVAPWEVMWAEENAPAPDVKHVILRITGLPKVGQDESNFRDQSGILTITGNREFTLEVQTYGAGAQAQATAIDSAVEKPSVLQGLRDDGIAYVDSAPVQNLTYLVETRYRERAQVDMRFRIAESQTDDVGYFDHVEGEGTYESPGQADVVVPIEVPQT